MSLLTSSEGMPRSAGASSRRRARTRLETAMSFPLWPRPPNGKGTEFTGHFLWFRPRRRARSQRSIAAAAHSCRFKCAKTPAPTGPSGLRKPARSVCVAIRCKQRGFVLEG